MGQNTGSNNISILYSLPPKKSMEGFYVKRNISVKEEYEQSNGNKHKFSSMKGSIGLRKEKIALI